MEIYNGGNNVIQLLRTLRQKCKLILNKADCIWREGYKLGLSPVII
jgi:hypothetical protein